jgi:hypothetical protein
LVGKHNSQSPWSTCSLGIAPRTAPSIHHRIAKPWRIPTPLKDTK